MPYATAGVPEDILAVLATHDLARTRRGFQTRTTETPAGASMPAPRRRRHAESMSRLYGKGERVLVRRDPGLEAVEAEIVANNFHRPHLVKVTYVHTRRAAWIARTRIVGPADPVDIPDATIPSLPARA